MPMIVVVPDPHALPYRNDASDQTRFLRQLLSLLCEKPDDGRRGAFPRYHSFYPTHYNISDEPRERAIAGASMGGLQSLETGIVHLGYFSWIGVFSPGLSGLSDEFKNALKDPNKINEICAFSRSSPEITILCWTGNQQFDSQLRALNIQHVYTVMPGTHSMFVWRPALSNFLQKIFKD